MNRSKRLCVLLGVLAAVCGATLIVMQVEDYKEQIRTSEEIILEIPGDSVQSLSWEYEGETLSFHKEETWLYDGDETFPVSEDRINELLEPFREFGVSFVIENVEDYGQYGLDSPVCVIELSTQSQSWEILAGDYSAMDSKRYVSIGDGNVYLVQDDPLNYFDAGLRDMIANDDTPYFERVSSIRFSGEESYAVVYEEDSASTYSPEDVYFAQLGGKKLPLDTSKVEGYLMTVSALKPSDYAAYNVTEEELSAYGLDSPELTVTIEYVTEDEEQDTFVLRLGRDPEERDREGGAQEDGEDEEFTAYARIGDSRIVYRVSSDRYRELTAALYDDLRHSEVLWADFTDIRRIDIALEGSDYVITSQGEGDERAWFYQDEELETGDLQAALEALGADSFTSERPTGKEEIVLTVYLDNENIPEVAVGLYRYDGERCLAAVDGQPVSLVKRSDVVGLIEAVHAIVLG